MKLIKRFIEVQLMFLGASVVMFGIRADKESIISGFITMNVFWFILKAIKILLS